MVNLLPFFLVVQAPFILRRLRMEMKMSVSSNCLCSNVLGNTALIPEHKDTLFNTTLLSHDGCHMQESPVKSENPKVDIEVDLRFFLFF